MIIATEHLIDETGIWRLREGLILGGSPASDIPAHTTPAMAASFRT